MTAPIRAMIVDDEPLARARIRGLLARQPDLRLVAECADGAAAREAIAADHPEVVFLDIEMAEVSGLAVAEGLAQKAEPGPAVVFVTAHERYARQAFDVRAIDYLMKPFEEDRFRATLDRVRAYARAARWEAERRRAPPEVLRFADLELATAERVARRGGRPLALRPKEFDLLRALVACGGGIVTRRELLTEVWGYREGVSSRTVDTHVALLRRKLGYRADQAGYVASVAKAGYRLTLPKEASTPDSRVPRPAPLPPHTLQHSSARHAHPGGAHAARPAAGIHEASAPRPRSPSRSGFPPERP
jgi:DNA-binding response OmpR family regulator